jgi:hypothetical protein
MNERRVILPGYIEGAPGHTFRKRGPQPEVNTMTTSQDREMGELNLARLAAAATLEAARAERRGKPLVVAGDGTSIKSAHLRMLVAAARQDLGKMPGMREDKDQQV